MVAPPGSRFEGQLSWRVESDQLDFAPTDLSPGKRPGFGVVDTYAKYRIPSPAPEFKEIALFGKVQNLLNRDYEERKGYPAPGINFLLGAEVSI